MCTANIWITSNFLIKKNHPEAPDTLITLHLPKINLAFQSLQGRAGLADLRPAFSLVRNSSLVCCCARFRGGRRRTARLHGGRVWRVNSATSGDFSFRRNKSYMWYLTFRRSRLSTLSARTSPQLTIFSRTSLSFIHTVHVIFLLV